MTAEELGNPRILRGPVLQYVCLKRGNPKIPNVVLRLFCNVLKLSTDVERGQARLDEVMRMLKG